MDETWRADLGRWLEPFSAGLSHRARQAMLPLSISRLIGPGEGKIALEHRVALGFPRHPATPTQGPPLLRSSLFLSPSPMPVADGARS